MPPPRYPPLPLPGAFEGPSPSPDLPPALWQRPRRRPQEVSPVCPFFCSYFLKGALAGGICCSITHGALTPVDVVKTRIQLDPVKYNSGMLGGFRQIAAEEGTGALLTGLGPTAVGYFIQGERPHSRPPSAPAKAGRCTLAAGAGALCFAGVCGLGAGMGERPGRQVDCGR